LILPTIQLHVRARADNRLFLTVIVVSLAALLAISAGHVLAHHRPSTWSAVLADRLHQNAVLLRNEPHGWQMEKREVHSALVNRADFMHARARIYMMHHMPWTPSVHGIQPLGNVNSAMATISLTSVVHMPFLIVGFRTLFQRCAHCAGSRLSNAIATNFQCLAP
jgi:hypothetical protein